MTTLNLKIINDNFPDFLNRLKDLAAIDNTIKLIIDNDNILMYSMLMNGNSIMAMKSYLLNTADYFSNKEDIDIHFILKDTNRIVKQLNFLDLDKEIKWKVDFKEINGVNHTRSSILSSGKFRITIIGGELSEIKSIDKQFLIERLDRSNSKWGFITSGNTISDIKKLASIYNDEKAISLEVCDGIVSFNELSHWNLEISTIDDSIKETLLFSKKYLSNIDLDSEEIHISIFETFIMVSDDKSNLILSFEQTYDDDK